MYRQCNACLRGTTVDRAFPEGTGVESSHRALACLLVCSYSTHHEDLCHQHSTSYSCQTPDTNHQFVIKNMKQMMTSCV